VQQQQIIKNNSDAINEIASKNFSRHFTIRAHIHTYRLILYLNFFASLPLLLLPLFHISYVCFYTDSAVVCMSVCVFLRKQSHFTNHSLLFTQHVLCVLRDLQSVRIDNLSNYEYIPVFNGLNKVTKKPYLPVGQLLIKFE
jgi:hypothetical protein